MSRIFLFATHLHTRCTLGICICITALLAAAPGVYAEDAPRLCQADASGAWHCSERAEPPPRRREGAPIPQVETRLRLPAPPPEHEPPPVVVTRSRAPVAAAANATDVPALDATAPPRSRVRILAQPRSAWALQLIATTSRESLERIAEQYELYDHPAVRLASGTSVRYALIWDVYPTRAQAEAAIKALPSVLRAMNPWVRPVGPLQDAMNAATRLSPPTS